jgi:hypothetical protein
MQVVCEGILKEGHIDVPYTGKVVLTYEDGLRIEELEEGIYRGVGAYDSQVVVKRAEPVAPEHQTLVGSVSRLTIDPDFKAPLNEKFVVAE